MTRSERHEIDAPVRVGRLVGVPAEADTLADFTDSYARMAVDLEAMMEAENERHARWCAQMGSALGELQTALDEIAARARRGDL